jgi:two-component system, NtrC family, sensor histidine kinase KinB
MRSLRHKLLLSYALLVVAVVMGGGWSIHHFTVLGRFVRLIMANNYRSVLDAERMKETLERQDSAMTFHIAGNDRKAVTQYEANRRRFAASYADAADNITEIGEPEAIRDIGQQFNAYTRLARSFLYSRRPAAEQSRLYFAVLEPAFVRLKNRCDDLLKINQDAMLRGQHRAEREAAAATRATVALSLGLLILGIVYSINLSRALVAPLGRLTAAAKRIGEGDLDLEIAVQTGDEVEVLADEFNRMAASLRQYREREAARLQVAEQQAEAAINSLYEPVVVTGAKGEVIHLNRAAAELFGPEEQRIHRPVEDLALEPLTRAIREAIQHRTAVAPDSERALATIKVDHGERSYRVRTAPLLRGAADVAGTVTVLEDVTRLRELDRLKDEFISVASHELRTPLTSLQMAVQLLAEGSAGPLMERQQRLVQMATLDAERLDRLTRDLLDLARLEAGTAVPHRRPVRPLDAIQMAIEPLRPQAEGKGVTLSVQAEPSLPLVSADLEQLSRAVSNLVGNAIQHTPSDGGVTVTAEPSEGGSPPSACMRFTVRDTGEGIPPEYLARVFERFVQVPGATAGGAGLGLPIAKKIVEAHGGQIWAESEPGRGAQFHFTMPLYPPDGRPKASENSG